MPHFDYSISRVKTPVSDFTVENVGWLFHCFSVVREKAMDNLKIVSNFKTVSTYVLLTVLFTGCSKNTSHYFTNAPDPSTKMKHHTTILNAETHQLVDSVAKRLSEVNFKYEEITTH